jgi:ATP-binding cassette, subfamily B, bacterial
LQLLIPQIMRTFIDAVIDGAALSFLARLGALFLVTALIQQVLAVFSTYFTQNIGWRATNALREDLARHALNLDMRFHKSHPPGEMISRIDSDITTLNDFFSQFLLKLVGNAILVVAILFILYREDWRIGLVLTAFTLVALFVLTRFRNIAVPHWEAERKAEADFYSFLEERLGGTVDIRANGGRPYTLRRFFAHIQVMYQRSIKAALMVNYMLNTMFLIFALGNAVSLGVGGSLYLNGAITIGTVYIIYQYNRMLERPLEDISRQLSNVQRSLASVKRIYELFANHVEVTRPADATTPSLPLDQVNPWHCSLRVSLSTMMMHQPIPGKNRLRTSWKTSASPWRPGEVLGLLGRTGSGKTTLTRLLFRLYDPQTGQIKISASSQPQDLVDSNPYPCTPCAAGSAWSPRTSSCSMPRCATT